MTGIAAAIVIIAAFVAWRAYEHWKSAQTPPSAPPEVGVVAPEQRQMDRTLGLLRQFAATEQVELRAQVGGIITQIRFRDGDVVRKGALLFVIDEVPYQIKLDQANAQLQSAEARLELANRTTERSEGLRKKDAVSQEEVDQRLASCKLQPLRFLPVALVPKRSALLLNLRWNVASVAAPAGQLSAVEFWQARLAALAVSIPQEGSAIPGKKQRNRGKRICSTIGAFAIGPVGRG